MILRYTSRPFSRAGTKVALRDVLDGECFSYGMNEYDDIYRRVGNDLQYPVPSRITLAKGYCLTYQSDVVFIRNGWKS
jgi:hypothetical protein